MEAGDFVYLHTHSHFSLLEALPKPKALVKRAKELGMKALAMTDNGSMYGAVDFFKACKEAEIQPILGCDLYIAAHGMHDKRPRVDEKSSRLVVLVENEEGYRNLCAIVTAGFIEGFYYKPRVDKPYLRNHARGLIALSGGVTGEIPAALGHGDMSRARELLQEYLDIFGRDHFFLELICQPDSSLQVEINDGLRALAREMDVPLVATRNVFYLNTEDREGYEAQLCIARSRTLEDFRRTNTEELDLSFGTPQEIMEYFADTQEAIENTQKIAQRITFSLELGKNFLPVYPLPAGKTDNDVLKELCEMGLRDRYGDNFSPEVQERFDFEYATIVKMGFASYFLIVQDYINWAKDNKVMVGPGRGSAAGSIVAYALKITDIDPLRYGLLFERFLNPDRVSMPDIDTDFADSGRGKVLHYITEKYGADKVAGIITYGTMMPRAAVRDAARVLGLSFQEADRIAKVIPPPEQGKHMPLKDAVEQAQDLRMLVQSDPTAARVVELAMKFEGNPRHASQHACGIVIGDRPLVERVPLQFGQRDDMAMVTQYSLNAAEAVGLVKMDFLGLSNLSIIEDTVDIIRAVHGVAVDVDHLPLDDAQTFALLGRGDTTGVFQLESDGMKRYIRELQPTKFEDIIAMVSLYRPGPMQFIESFIRRKHGIEQIVYEHPLMENAFRETYGIPVYQEQVMQVSKDLAGFTAGEADGLRKAMGKKLADLMAKMKVKFIEGAVRNGVTEKTATEIFQKLEDFAAYGFNKSHAACYALIAYRTAYLKAYYPECFMAALMNADAGNIDRIRIEVEECSRIGLRVLAPNVNESFAGFAVVKGTKNIRWGLMAIKNVGTEIAKDIVRERKEHGPFADLADFLRRLHGQSFNKKVLEALIKSGALDHFGERHTMLHNLDALVEYNKQVAQEHLRNQSSLFDLSAELGASKLVLSPGGKTSQSALLAFEKELLGLYVSEHPANLFHKSFCEAGVLSVANVSTLPDGHMAHISGVIVEIKQIYTKKKNEPMAFVKIEDPSGSLEAVVFPKIYAGYRDVFVEGAFVVCNGKVSVRKKTFQEGEDDMVEEVEERSLLVDGVTMFFEEDIPAMIHALRAGASLPVTSEGQATDRSLLHSPRLTLLFASVPGEQMVAAVRGVLGHYPGDIQVCIEVATPTDKKTIATEYRVKVSPVLVKSLEELLGQGNVVV